MVSVVSLCTSLITSGPGHLFQHLLTFVSFAFLLFILIFFPLLIYKNSLCIRGY